jgi:hypothetical protein
VPRAGSGRKAPIRPAPVPAGARCRTRRNRPRSERDSRALPVRPPEPRLPISAGLASSSLFPTEAVGAPGTGGPRPRRTGVCASRRPVSVPGTIPPKQEVGHSHGAIRMIEVGLQPGAGTVRPLARDENCQTRDGIWYFRQGMLTAATGRRGTGGDETPGRPRRPLTRQPRPPAAGPRDPCARRRMRSPRYRCVAWGVLPGEASDPGIPARGSRATHGPERRTPADGLWPVGY